MTFSDDIKSKDTNLYPVVVIDKDGENEIRISTNSTTIGGQYYQPILLNVPSLKESIDIEKRNYKISNVSLSISNYEHDGVRFSETVGDNSLINKSVDIYWISPSVTSLGGAKRIYHGWILRYDMDSDKVKLIVEDRSQAKLHKDLPLPEAWLGTGADIPDKYKNKALPMVYGNVNKSPLVFKIYGDDAEALLGIKLYSDFSESVQFNESAKDWYVANLYNINTDTLWIVDDDIYYNVLKTPYGSNDTSDNYIVETNTIMFPVKGETGSFEQKVQLGLLKIPTSCYIPQFGGIQTVENIANVVTQTNEYATANYNGALGAQPATTLLQYEKYSDKDVKYVYHFLLADIRYEVISIEYDPNYNYLNQFVLQYNKWIKDLPSQEITTAADGYFMPGGDVKDYDFYANYSTSMTAGASTKINNLFVSSQLEDGTIETNNGLGALDIQVGDRESQHMWGHGSATTNMHFFSNYSINSDSDYGYGALCNFSLIIHPSTRYTYEDSTSAEIEVKIGGIAFYNIIDTLGVTNRDFYANVIGRLPEPTAPEVINHIMEYELGQSISTDYDPIYDWTYAFTIKDKINSKKLIEEIASASPYIPRFNNMGQWKFDVIQEYYDQTDIDSSTRILESDVIKYSYSRTKIEDVNTKIEFKYNFDYGLDEYQSKTEFTLEDVLPDGGSGYDRNYYGLTGDNDSTLVVDDRRGFYIRDDDTADSFATWLLRWKCNQHLKIKLKLPLKYLDIEVGSLISFDEVLGDVLPYGINYKHDAVYGDNLNLGNNINGQQVFSLFMCTSTNKTLTHIDIEVIQLHNLGEEPLARNSVLGCMTFGNWNTYTGANGIDDGSCVNVFDFIQPLCGLDENPLNDDYSDNFDINIHPGSPQEGYDTSSFLPNVFISGMPETYPDHNNAIDAAKAYWEAGNIPKIYDYSMCTWQTTNYHILEGITISIKDSDGVYIIVGSIIITEENIHDAVIDINLTTEMIDRYNQDDGLWFKFDYAFNTDTTPTFSGDSRFTYDCLRYNELNDFTSIIDGGEQSEVDVYANDPVGQYSSEAFFTRGSSETPQFYLIDDPETEDVIEVYDFTLKYNLSPLQNSNPELTEFTGQATLRFTGVEEDEDIINPADMNNDNAFNVLDIVLLANCVIAENFPCVNGDMNDDGNWNVLDIVTLANCVLAENCELYG